MADATNGKTANVNNAGAKTHRAALIELQAATIILAFASILRKWIDAPEVIIVGLRGWMGAAALLAWLYLRGQRPLRCHSLTSGGNSGGGGGAWIMLSGVILCIHWVTYFYAIRVSTVAVAMIALFTFPVITAFIEPLCFGDRFSRRTFFNAALVLAGVALLVPEFSFANDVTRGVIVGLGSAVLFAVRNVMNRKSLQHHDGVTIMMWQTVAVAVVLTPWLIGAAVGDLAATSGGGDFADSSAATSGGGAATMNEGAFPISGGEWWSMLALGVICTAVGHTLFITCLSHLSVSTASVINCLQPIYGTLLAIILLGEIPHWATAAGGALILAAVIHEVLTHEVRVEEP
jgi:drug/metabolite transporter (DMT)-like permease